MYSLVGATAALMSRQTPGAGIIGEKAPLATPVEVIATHAELALQAVAAALTLV
jgi:hypothetical protein